MTWTAADFALILTTLGTLWGVVYPALNGRSERSRARVKAIANEFHEVLSGCILNCEKASNSAKNRAINLAYIRAGGNLSEDDAKENRDGDDFALYLRRLEVLGIRYGLDIKNALYLGTCLQVHGDHYEFREGELVRTSDPEREEPAWSLKNRGEFLQEIGSIYLKVDGWIESGSIAAKK